MSKASVLEKIGNTPLVQLNLPVPATVYAKLEHLNPGGSLKDRSALFMIEKAEQKGFLKPGGTIIDASSGNYGIALAMIGATKGYKVIICVPDRVSEEKQQTIKAYGARLIVCKDTANHADPNGYHSMAVKLHNEIPHSFMPNQYENPANALGHYYSLGPEIWEQTQGKITHFIAGAGTCGTLAGAGKYLKEKNKNIQVIGVDSCNSYRATNGKPLPYCIEGIGVDLDSELVDPKIIDEFIEVTDKDSFDQAKSLAQNGCLVGLSSGAVICAIEKYAKNLSKDNIVVTIFGDSGRAYLKKLFQSTN